MNAANRIIVLALLLTAAAFPAWALAAAAEHAPPATRALLDKQLITLALWGLFGTFLFLLALGLTNRVVIFYDGWDAFWAIVPLVSVVVSVLIWVSIIPDTTHPAHQTDGMILPVMVLIAGGLSALIGGIVTLYNAVKYNRNVPLGVLIGVCKLVISILLIVLSLGYLLGPNDKRTRGQNLFALIALGAIAWLWIKLVNGERVYEKRGWAAPT
ncbi:MAG: hypothetical protein ACYDB9_11255 [Gammaproteobacteria bacterium]